MRQPANAARHETDGTGKQGDGCQRAAIDRRTFHQGANDEEMFRRRYGANLAFMNLQIAKGGAERFESVTNALAMLKPETIVIAVPVTPVGTTAPVAPPGVAK